MGRKLSSVLDKISQNYEERKSHIDVAAFIPACDFVENGQLLSNLAYILANNDFNVCVVDFKVFYPNLFYWFGVPPNKKGKGLIQLLKNDRADIKSIVTPTQVNNLFLLSPSPMDNIESYYSFEFRHIDNTIGVLRENFDIVLIDAPNNPPLEFCLGSMKNCMQGFFTAAERVDVLGNMMKLILHADSVNMGAGKFLEVVFMNSYDTVYDFKSLVQNNFKIAAHLPFVKEAWECPLEGKLYLRDAQIVNKIYAREMQKLAERFF